MSSIDATGLQEFSDGTIPTLVVESLSAPLIPVSIFPDFRTDAGVQSFGGARYISVFEDGAVEGASTARVTGAFQTMLSSFGGIQLIGTADPAYLYKIRIRLRSELNDVNYVDRVVQFRVVTPLMVPFAIETYDANDIPDIDLDGNGYNFVYASPAGTFPSGEIRLRDGRGGILLPNEGSYWSPEAAAFMNEQLARQREAIITIDFMPGTNEEAVARVKYRVTANAALNALTTSEQYRRQDFSTWGYFSGTDIDFIQASVDMTQSSAEVTFLRGLYAIGPRFETVTVIGSAGQVVINPAAVQTGETIDVSAAINFDRKSHLSATGLLDKFLMLVCTTDSAIYIREIPLRPKGTWDAVAQDGVTNYWTERTSNVVGNNIPLLYCRVFTWPYLEFPNLTAVYDVLEEFFPTGTNPIGTLPDITNIRLYAGNTDSPDEPNVTYADEADMVANMFSIRMPDVGISKLVIDTRKLRVADTNWTAIPETAPFLRIEADIRWNVSPEETYSVTAWYCLNPDGQPSAWQIPEDDPVDVPLLAYDRETKALTITLQDGSMVLSEPGTLLVRTDAEVIDAGSSPGFGVPVSGDQDIEIDLSASITDQADYIEVDYTLGTSPQASFSRRISTKAENRLVTGVSDIGALFLGSAVIFTDVSNVAETAEGFKEVTIVGDGAAQVIPDVEVGVTYFLNLQSNSAFHPRRLNDWIDLRYNGASPTEVCTKRVYNEGFDFRSANPRSMMIADKSAWGLGGQDREFVRFDVPNLRFLVSQERMETAADGRTYNFLQWRLTNLATGAEASFVGAMTAGRSYQLGRVLEGITQRAYVLLSVLHRNGSQIDFICTVDPGANPNFVAPRSTKLTGVL